MRKLLYLTFCIMCSVTAYSQGWVSNDSNRLYSVNKSLGLSPVFVGIGTNNPAAQFHTTGSLRFSGITQNNVYNRILQGMFIGAM